jgi:hypothetical protein
MGVTLWSSEHTYSLDVTSPLQENILETLQQQAVQNKVQHESPGHA